MKKKTILISKKKKPILIFTKKSPSKGMNFPKYAQVKTLKKKYVA